MFDPRALYSLSYGVYIVSTWDAAHNRPTGCVANSIMQVTSAPPTVAVSLNHGNYTADCVRESGRLAVNILSQNADPELIRRFGFSSGRDTDKFAGVAHDAPDGLAVLPDSCGWFSGRVINRLDTATHTVFLLEAEQGQPLESAPPMTYAYYRGVVKGLTAKNAPTYHPPEETAKSASAAETPAGGARWRCIVCGYEYKGDIPFEALPEDWRCPLCGAPKAKFALVEA